jgi:hypothetical protein
MTEYRCHECGGTLSEKQYAARLRSSKFQLFFVFGGTAILLLGCLIWGAFFHPESCAPHSPCLFVRHLFISP